MTALLRCQGFRPLTISYDCYVTYDGVEYRVDVPGTAEAGDLFEITMPDGRVVVGCYEGRDGT